MTAVATPTTEPTAEQITPEQALERSRTVLNWLLDGVPSSAAVKRAQQEWQLGPRMAQVYIKRAKQLLAEKTDEEEFRYYCQLSQQQRDMLLQMVLGAVKIATSLDPGQLRALATLAATGTKLLDSRDKLVFGQVKHAADEARKQRREEFDQILRESQELLKRVNELPPSRSWGKPPQPKQTPPRRELDPGEVVFSAAEPIDLTRFSAKQQAEWDALDPMDGNPYDLPWILPGAFDKVLAQSSRKTPNATEGISIVKPSAPPRRKHQHGDVQVNR